MRTWQMESISFLVKCRRQGHILGRDVRFKQLEYGKHLEHVNSRGINEYTVWRSREVQVK